jgi:hypothetical protein
MIDLGETYMDLGQQAPVGPTRLPDPRVSMINVMRTDLLSRDHPKLNLQPLSPTPVTKPPNDELKPLSPSIAKRNVGCTLIAIARVLIANYLSSCRACHLRRRGCSPCQARLRLHGPSTRQKLRLCWDIGT